MPEVSLPPVCDRAAAETVHAELSDALSSQPIDVDGSDVTKVGLLVLQILVSATKSEGGIRLVEPSKQLSETIALFGLEEALIKDGAS